MMATGLKLMPCIKCNSVKNVKTFPSWFKGNFVYRCAACGSSGSEAGNAVDQDQIQYWNNKNDLEKKLSQALALYKNAKNNLELLEKFKLARTLGGL